MCGPCRDSWLESKWELWQVYDPLSAGVRAAVGDGLHHEERGEARTLETLLHDPHRLEGDEHVIVTIDSN